MSVIIDNSVAMAWVLPDESVPLADLVLDRVVYDGGHVPFHFPAEYANGLTFAMRRGRIDAAARSEAFRHLPMLKLVRDIDGAGRLDTAMEIADLYRLTVYDALYLELAQRLRLPLATLDDALARATRQAGVALAVPLD